jgi:hypothetical protein
MGSSGRKKEYQSLEKQLSDARAKQTEVSPIEQSYLDQFNQTQNLLNSHDYRNLGQYFNLAPLADLQRMQQYGYSNNGQVATGADTSGLVQQQRDLASNELTRDYGNMVQSVVQGLQGQNNQVGGAYEGIRDQRLQNGVNGVGMQMNALVNRPHSAWYNVGQGLLKAGLGVGTSLLTGGFSNLFGGGGGGFGGIDHGGFGH